MTERLYFSPETIQLVSVEDCVANTERILPLAKLLLNEEFPYEIGDFPRIRSKEWTAETGIEIGRLIADDIMLDDPAAPITQEMVRRLDVLGVFPNFNFIRKHYGTLSIFTNEIDALCIKGSTLFNEDSNFEIIEAILNEKVHYRRPITEQWLDQMYRVGKLPHRSYLNRRGIGVREINDLLGFPDVRKWSKEDYILFGAEFIRINGLESLTTRNALLIAKRSLGPYPSTVKEKFGSWGAFKNSAVEEFNRQSEEQRLRESEVNEFYFSKGGRNSVNIKVKSRYRALCLMSEHFNLSEKIPLEPTTNFRKAYLRSLQRKSGASQETIEMAATQYDILDDLWYIRSQYRKPKLIKVD